MRLQPPIYDVFFIKYFTQGGQLIEQNLLTFCFAEKPQIDFLSDFLINPFQ